MAIQINGGAHYFISPNIKVLWDCPKMKGEFLGNNSLILLQYILGMDWLKH